MNDRISEILIKLIDHIINDRNEVLAENDKLHDEIERLQDRWIPVSERLPEVDGAYLTYGFWKEIIIGDFIRFSIPEWNVQGVTHWMPLPPPPEDK